MNVKLVLEYDGTAFHGWQVQPGGRRTVAGELGAALRGITGADVKLVAAGRTDAGAHSLGQTVNVELPDTCDVSVLPARLNRALPADVTVLSAEQVDPGFHARFSARRRTYVYLVENRETRPAVMRNRAWWVRQPLDVVAMQEAAFGLTGRHDLGAFGTDPAGRNTVRNLQGVSVRSLAGRLVAFELSADAFLYGMVRRIVGFLVEVGLGRRDPAEAGTLVEPGARSRARVAPAAGLYQLRVEY